MLHVHTWYLGCYLMPYMVIMLINETLCLILRILDVWVHRHKKKRKLHIEYTGSCVFVLLVSGMKVPKLFPSFFIREKDFYVFPVINLALLSGNSSIINSKTVLSSFKLWLQKANKVLSGMVLFYIHLTYTHMDTHTHLCTYLKLSSFPMLYILALCLQP